MHSPTIPAQQSNLAGQTSKVKRVWANSSHRRNGASIAFSVSQLMDYYDDLFLFQHITEPTRFRQEEIPNLLDLVFTNEQDMINNLSYLPPLGSSDHICIEFDLICYPEPRKSVNLKYNIRAANIELMKQALGDVDWVSTLHTLDANGAWLLFKTIFQDIIDKYVPTYKQREKKSLYSNSEVFSLRSIKTSCGKSIFLLVLLLICQTLKK